MAYMIALSGLKQLGGGMPLPWLAQVAKQPFYIKPKLKIYEEDFFISVDADGAAVW